MLREDMQRALGEQQFSTVSVLAGEINERLRDRMQALETIAGEITPAMLANSASMQTLLEQRPLLQRLFNGGVFVTGTDGTVIADVPLSSGRIGTNYMDRESVSIPLKEVKTVIGRPAMGKKLGAPIFSITAPIFDGKGQVVGVLVGTVNLGKPNFLDAPMNSPYGRTGGYVLIAAQYRMVVTATDKSRVMEPLPGVGSNVWVDRFANGYEGSAIATNPKGVVVLVSGKGIPIAQWYLLATLPVSEAFAPLYDFQQRLLWATLLLTLLTGILTCWVLKRQLAPLVATADAMATLADTNQIAQPLTTTRSDEIGHLVDGFNRILTRWKQREAALITSEERWKFAIEGAGDGLWDWNIQEGKAFYSPRYKTMLGFAEDEIGDSAEEWSKRIHPEDAPGVFATLQPYMEGRSGSANVEFRMLCKDGGWRWIQGRGMVVARDGDGKPLRMIGTNTDISERKDHERTLKHIAHFDALTNLANRILLADRLQQAMAQAQRRQQHLAVVYLDLDGFKRINDRYGHQIGDQVLITLAARMKETLREGDTLARLGGDEFVAVLIDLDDAAGCTPLLIRLLEAAAQPVAVDDLSLQVSASLGVTFYPQKQDLDADQLLRQADQAMYQAKLAGKNRYHVFDAEQDSHLRLQHESLERIRQALNNGEFVLYYQPKVNMRSGTVIGAEALIRWQHPEKGLLAPAAFLPIIENHPLAVDVGEWVISTALAQMQHWRAVGLDLPVSVNIGARQLQQGNFVTRLRSILAAHQHMRPDWLELEVLETSALADMAQVSQVIDDCAQFGVRYSLDDFGTGYSSLIYLKRLHVTTLKIDQSFVRDMLDDPDDLAILQGIIGLAAAFKRQVIAEGVETVAHGIVLLQLGCELAQGYGIARPMPADNLPGWVADWPSDAAWRALSRPGP
ncbi:MAG: EAL domain-containing protein [Rhodoferax sp.]|nr:EAL domain-containing protein [Rhodoferax sp.]